MKKALSIKGGGIRGVIPGLVIGYIESITGKPVSELFDLVAGTSTGGILAMGLTVPDAEGRPKYSAEEMTNLYAERGQEIFTRPWLKGLCGLTDERYPHEPLERILKEYFGDAVLRDALTKVMITSYEFVARHPIMFKSWHPETGLIKMTEAGRATSAAPTYFEPCQVSLNDILLSLVDGGLKVNHPAMCAYAEMCRLWPDEEYMIVSIGTGKPTREIKFEEAKDWGINWVPHIIEIAMDGTEVDYQSKWILGETYHDFDTFLDIASDDMDDATPENIKNLRREAAKLIMENVAAIDEVCEKL